MPADLYINLPIVAPMPPVPRTIEQAGLPFMFLIELATKVMFQRGRIKLAELSTHLKLGISVLDPLIVFMRAEKMCEVSRRGDSGTDADLTYDLTDWGRVRANEFMNRNAYCGPAPVNLADYCARVDAQSVAQAHVLQTAVLHNFKGVVVSPAVLEQLGAAMNSGRAIFIHGVAGSGKTYLAERLCGLLKGEIWVPHAVLIDGEVIQCFDNAVHVRVGPRELHDNTLDRKAQHDTRWVLTRRPAVLTGGELTLAMLDLQFDEATRFYQAPPHLKANGGIFIIDDLGRQRCSAAELMNRWIVPLDRRVDYLSLHTGHKFLVPFDVVVVFSSNFLPDRLSDGAFLRRLGYKIEIGGLNEEQYGTVFRQVCADFCIPYSEEAFGYLVHTCHQQEQRPLLACYPRDLLGQVRDIARFRGVAPVLTTEVLDWAWHNYFADSGGRELPPHPPRGRTIEKRAMP